MYELQDLKMNIKFEIEMLCQKFNVTLADVPKYGRLRTRMTPSKEKNPDFNSRARAAAEASVQPEAAAAARDAAAGERDADGRGQAGAADGRGAAGGGDARGGGAGPGAKPPADQQTVIPNLASYVTINPSLEAFATHPQLKEVCSRLVCGHLRLSFDGAPTRYFFQHVCKPPLFPLCWEQCRYWRNSFV